MLHNHPPWLLQCISRSFNKERFPRLPRIGRFLLEYERIKIKLKFFLSSRIGLLGSIWLGAGGCTSALHPNDKRGFNYQQRLQLGLKSDKRKQIGEKLSVIRLQLWSREFGPGRCCCPVVIPWIGQRCSVPGSPTLLTQEGLCCWGTHRASEPTQSLPRVDTGRSIQNTMS